jgi:hypothetical protein
MKTRFEDQSDMSIRSEYIMRYEMNSKEITNIRSSEMKMANEWKNGWNGNKENTEKNPKYETYNENGYTRNYWMNL